MHELELKFQVPEASREAVRQAVQAGGRVATVRLQAVYADTADARLAAAGLALRLRKQGRRWVQALKGRGDGLLLRLEHEVVVPPQRGRPLPDPSRHDGTAAGSALRQALAGAALQERYRTDIRRTQRTLRHRGTTIEIALDEGHIDAGDRSVPVCELEMELKGDLKGGDVAALLQLAGTWAQRHGLWLDVRSKSERGHRLAQAEDGAPPVRAGGPGWSAPASCAAVAAAALRSSLAQALPNAAELCSGSGSAEHLHQLRVGLRRLRSALRLLGDWYADPTAAAALEAAWQPLFARLGAVRDDDAIEAAFGAALRTAGAPELPALPVATSQAGELLRDPAFTRACLQALALAGLPSTRAEPASLRDAAAGVLARAWKEAMRDARGFAEADVVRQHRLRKRLKRLRYVAEFLQPLWPERRTRPTFQALRFALEALGDWNDLLLAQARFAERSQQEPAAWFAVGWLAAQRPRQLRRCTRRLDRLVRAPRYWKKA